MIASTISPLLNVYCIWKISGGRTFESKFSSCISPKIPRCFWLPKIFSNDFIWFAKLNTCSLVPLIFASSLVTSLIILLESANCFCIDDLDDIWKSEISLLITFSLDSISNLLFSELSFISFLMFWIWLDKLLVSCIITSGSLPPLFLNKTKTKIARIIQRNIIIINSKITWLSTFFFLNKFHRNHHLLDHLWIKYFHLYFSSLGLSFYQHLGICWMRIQVVLLQSHLI